MYLKFLTIENVTIILAAAIGLWTAYLTGQALYGFIKYRIVVFKQIGVKQRIQAIIKRAKTYRLKDPEQESLEYLEKKYATLKQDIRFTNRQTTNRLLEIIYYGVFVLTIILVFEYLAGH